MRRETTAGEVMEVDFGYLGLTWHTTTRSRRRTWVFSGRLRHSRRAYREVVFDQKQQTFFACHIHAFEWFGGVSEKATPDNLKAAIIVASFEDPVVNRAYRELALHYGFLISPCLPYHPEHKGGVEGDIKYVKRNFPPPELEQYLSLSRAGLVQWAKRLGPSVALVAQEVFADQAVDGMRPVRALIRLADKYTVQRLEAACRRAVQFATPSYRSVKNILIHELDRLPQQQPAEPDNGQLQFRFAREFGYFDTDPGTATAQESRTPAWTN